VSGAKLEPSLASTPIGETVQFERLGYFTLDSDSKSDALVFNRTLTLKDTWAKVATKH
jgi:glutaminyl-tRNA synthetase